MNLENLYQLARRALEMQDDKSAKMYYESILLEDHNNWEAIFFSTYIVVDAKYSELNILAKRMQKCIPIVLKKIEENLNGAELLLLAGRKDATSIHEARNSIEVVFENSVRYAKWIYVEAENYYNAQQSRYNEHTPLNIIGESRKLFVANRYEAIRIMYILGDTIQKYFGESEFAKQQIAWEYGTKWHIEIISQFENREIAKQEILSYVEKIQEIDPEYPTPEIKTSGCYIATSVYGTYNCPQVWTLRRFRDDVLDKKCWGKRFIDVYYSVSPVLVKWFGKKIWIQKTWRKILDSIVKKLNSKGISDLPYDDKN